MTPRQRRWNRKHPAPPPPTPRNKVYARRPGGRLVLVHEKELSDFRKQEMDAFDALPEEVRRAMADDAPRECSAQNWGTVQQFKQNAKTASAGFGLAF